MKKILLFFLTSNFLTAGSFYSVKYDTTTKQYQKHIAGSYFWGADTATYSVKISSDGSITAKNLELEGSGSIAILSATQTFTGQNTFQNLLTIDRTGKTETGTALKLKDFEGYEKILLTNDGAFYSPRGFYVGTPSSRNLALERDLIYFSNENIYLDDVGNAKCLTLWTNKIKNYQGSEIQVDNFLVGRISTSTYAESVNYNVEVATANFVRGSISTATYSFNSDKLDGYDSSYFAVKDEVAQATTTLQNQKLNKIKDENGNVKSNAYFISGSTIAYTDWDTTIVLPVNKINTVFIQPYGDTPLNLNGISLYAVFQTSFTIRNDEKEPKNIFWQAEVE